MSALTPEQRARLVEAMAKAIKPWAFNHEARHGWRLRQNLADQKMAFVHAEEAIAAAERAGFRWSVKT